MSTLPRDLQVLPAAAADHQRLLQWILFPGDTPASGSPLVQRLLERHQQGLLSLDILLQALSGSKSLGAAWGQVLAGRIGIIWPVRLLHDTSLQVGVALLDSIDAGFEQEGVVLPVSLVDTETATACSLHQQLLEMAGYQQQTRLLVMSMPITPSTEKPAGLLHYQACSDHLLLGTILEQTEVESEDIPEIHGIRSGRDVLATFEQEVTGSPHGWYVVRHKGDTVGCLLLASQGPQGTSSIQYMGLFPQYRARGWGRLMIDHALQWGRQHEARSLRLMVDSRNQKAMRLYQKCGLVTDHEQQFWMRQSDVRRG